MNKIVLIAVAAGTALTALSPALLSPAMAREGCGPGYHRGPRGHCRPNGGPGYGRPGPVVGNYYHGQGYWDGNRYWRNRYRDHGGWRYR